MVENHNLDKAAELRAAVLLEQERGRMGTARVDTARAGSLADRHVEDTHQPLVDSSVGSGDMMSVVEVLLTLTVQDSPVVRRDSSKGVEKREGMEIVVLEEDTAEAVLQGVFLPKLL